MFAASQRSLAWFGLGSVFVSKIVVVWLMMVLLLLLDSSNFVARILSIPHVRASIVG